eukprot:1047858-Amphidinium_carterae.2
MSTYPPLSLDVLEGKLGLATLQALGSKLVALHRIIAEDVSMFEQECQEIASRARHVHWWRVET